MKRQTSMVLRSWWLACLLAAGPVVFAGGSGPGGGNPAPAASGGDDVETVPIVTSGTGFILEGSVNDVFLAMAIVRGHGTVQVQDLGAGRVAAIYRGRFEIRLDPKSFGDGTLHLVVLTGGASRRLSTHGHFLFRSRD